MFESRYRNPRKEGTILMDAKTLTALKASIAKWEKNAKAREISDARIGLADCALCQLFHSYCGGPDCQGCPVNEAGRHWRCGNTPYDDVDGAFGDWDCGGSGTAFRRVARREVAFLKSLLPSGAA